MKCLEKDRTRRYQSASAFAGDVERYLTNQPILARPPSATYQLKKLLARHKAPFAFIAALFVVICSFSIWMTVLYRQAGAERDRAVDAERLAEERLAETEKARDDAELVTHSLADMLAAVDPGNEGRPATLRQMFDREAKTIGEKFKDQPLIEARLRATIARTYWGPGECDLAEQHLERALEIRRRLLGEEHPDTLSSMNHLAVAYADQGRCDEAEPLLLQALQTRQRVLGEEHPNTLISMHQLARVLRLNHKLDEAERLAREAVALYRKNPTTNTNEHRHALKILCTILEEAGRLDEAVPLFEQLLESHKRLLSEDDPDTLHCMTGLAELYKKQGRYDEAEALYLESPEGHKRVLGEDDPDALRAMDALAHLYHKQARYDEAVRLYLQVRETRKRLLGEDHPNTLLSMDNLAVMYTYQGRHDQAEALFHEAWGHYRKGRPHDRSMALAMLHYATLLLNKGDSAAAEPLLREALPILRKADGDESKDVEVTLFNLGHSLHRQGDLTAAESAFREALRIRRKLYRESGVAGVLHDLGDVLRELRKLDEAERLARQSVEIYRKTPSEQVNEHAHAVRVLTQVLQDAGRPGEVEAVWRESLAVLRLALPEGDVKIGGVLARFGLFLLKQEKYADAEPVLRECLAIREQKLPDHWLRFNAMSMLGGALADQTDELVANDPAAAQKRFLEAEQLLLEGYERLQPPPNSAYRKREALERIVKLYEAWDTAEPGKGYAAKAAEWRAKLKTVVESEQP